MRGNVSKIVVFRRLHRPASHAIIGAGRREGDTPVKKVLLLDPDVVYRAEVEKELEKDCCVYSCSSAKEGMLLLLEVRPDALLINLRLSGMDGLHFLKEMFPFLPRIIITRAASYSPYLEQHLLDLGVTYPLLNTVSVRICANHMRSFLERSQSPVPPAAQETVSSHLRILGVPRLGGFDDLRIGTPLFAQDPTMSMTKEFYPAVAVLRGRDNWKQVEKAIRAAKEAAYAQRDDDVWKQYFSDTSSCPKNKDFIAKLAEFIS